MTTWFLILVGLVSFLAGAAASVVGFGIGSLVTPIVALRFGTEVAVAVVALPHLSGGLLRGWQLRRSVDWRIVVRFGLLSAAGGLVGALVFARLAPSVLTRVLGALLVMTAIAGMTGWAQRWTPHGPLVWVLGGLSGFFGGVVGNQGGLRAAALSTFGLVPTAFVATSTITGVLIDLARVPVYIQRTPTSFAGLWPVVVVGILAVLAGTMVGNRILLGLSRERFRFIVSGAVGLLGLWFLIGLGVA
jgi:uncharacterized protein